MSSCKYLAKFLGTFLLVFLAVGAAVFGIGAMVGNDRAAAGLLGVAFAFGLVLIAICNEVNLASFLKIPPWEITT